MDLSQHNARQHAAGPRSQGFQRYKAYLRHANKHDLLEKYIANWFQRRRRATTALSILDIGAGTGRLARAALDAGTDCGLSLRLVAIEPCGEAVAEMREALSGCVNMGQAVEIIEADFDDAARRPIGKFDLILASHVSYYFADLDRFVTDAMKMLNDGGETIFVATSTTIMQNSLYQTLFRALRWNSALPRTFESDGFLTFAENLEIALVKCNAAYRRTSLGSAVTFCPAEINETIREIESGGCGSVLEAMSFLWRYPETALLSMRGDWLALLHDYRKRDTPLSLNYEDMALQAQR